MREILFKGKRVDNGEWIEGIAFPMEREMLTMATWGKVRNED